MSAIGELAWILVEHLALTGLPAVAAVLIARRRGLRSAPLLLGVALVASGCTAMIAFWAFFADPLIGESVSFLIVFGAVAAIAWAFVQGVDAAAMRPLLAPLALWILASAFILFLGFSHGGTSDPIATAATRFSRELPADNAIPRFFADWFYVQATKPGRRPSETGCPATGRAADRLRARPAPLRRQGRPPLPGARGGPPAALGRRHVGAALRGSTAPVRPRPAIVAAMVSDVAIVHGFFVWPKLIAAAFLLAALAMVLSEDWPRLRHSPYAAALLAALCGLAMLAHGSSVFCIVPLLGFAAFRGMPDWRWLWDRRPRRGRAAGALVRLPDLADPPGNRLIKWQLGGSLEIDDRGSLETIIDGYREVGLGGALEDKWGNVTQIVGAGEVGDAVREVGDALDRGEAAGVPRALAFRRFFALLPFLGFLLIGPVAMVLPRLRGRPDGPEWRFALACLAFCGFSCLLWVLLMFGNPGSTTTIHVGSLAVPLLAVVACVVGAYACHPRLGTVLAALNALFVLGLYLPSLSPPAGSAFSPIAMLVAAASLVGFGLVALRSP